MKNFIQYILNPVAIENTEMFTFKIYFKTIGLCYLLFFLPSLILILFNIFRLLPDYQILKADSLTILFLIAAIGPLFEEILFRLNLKISKLNIAAFAAVLIVLIIKLLFFRTGKLYVYFGVPPLFLLIYYTINRFDFPLHKLETFVKSNFKYVFHLCAIIFGMLHLTNFESIYWWMIVLSPLLTAPSIAMGYLFGYIRMKYGFSNGWLIHSTVNFIYVLMIMPKHFV